MCVGARVLGVPVAFFFEDIPGQSSSDQGFSETQSERYVVDFISSAEGLQLNKAFLRISNPHVRRKVVELVQAVSEDAD